MALETRAQGKGMRPSHMSTAKTEMGLTHVSLESGPDPTVMGKKKALLFAFSLERDRAERTFPIIFLYTGWARVKDWS